jgi:hypothetical protein
MMSSWIHRRAGDAPTPAGIGHRTTRRSRRHPPVPGTRRSASSSGPAVKVEWFRDTIPGQADGSRMGLV